MTSVSSPLVLRYPSVESTGHILNPLGCLEATHTVRMTTLRCTPSKLFWRWMVTLFNELIVSLFTLLYIRTGHQHVDILKIDIEGWEFETITTLLEPYIESGRPLPFAQLQLEIHLWRKPFEEFLGWWEKLEAAGLRPFWTEVCHIIRLADWTLTLSLTIQPNLVYLIYNKQHTPDLAEVRYVPINSSLIDWRV